MGDYVNELLRAYNESGTDWHRAHTSCYVGNEREIFCALSCRRGHPEEWGLQYTGWISVVKEQGGDKLPPLENCWFVLSDDCGALSPPIPRPTLPIGDEWNALHQIHTCGVPDIQALVFAHTDYPRILQIWNRIRRPYQDAFGRVKLMQIAPRPLQYPEETRQKKLYKHSPRIHGGVFFCCLPCGMIQTIMHTDPTLIIAFIGGLVSFLSPCVLPIIPGFLSYLAGASLEDAGTKRVSIFLNSVFFVLGFAMIFSLLGVLLNSILQSVAYDVQTWLARIGGALIIFFGLYLAHLIRIPALERTHTLAVKTKFQSKYITSFVFGAAFAAGWTPCVSVALGAILGLAATRPGLTFNLLFAYTLGLGVPFLLVGLFASQAASFINKHAAVLKYISIAFGVVLIGLGILIFTENLNLIANFELLNRWLLQ